jgi:hypothetical protein
MTSSNRLILAAKLLSSIFALIPAGFGAYLLWGGAHYHEPDPGPGNMPSFFPTALVLMAMGALIVLWSLPQLLLAIAVWLNRTSAFFTVGILQVIQGVVPMLLFVVTFRGQETQWSAGWFGLFSLSSGILLIVARGYVPARAMRGRGFPIVNGSTSRQGDHVY